MSLVLIGKQQQLQQQYHNYYNLCNHSVRRLHRPLLHHQHQQQQQQQQPRIVPHGLVYSVFVRRFFQSLVQLISPTAKEHVNLQQLRRDTRVKKKSKLDTYYRRLIMTKFFSDGWGSAKDIDHINSLLSIITNSPRQLHDMIPRDYPVSITPAFEDRHYKVFNGSFTSPALDVLGDMIPMECRVAKFQFVLPKERRERQRVCVHMAGTGDHYFWRRRLTLAKPLATNSGIGSIIVENPFYGLRKPKHQRRSSLRHLNDLFIMGASLIMESVVILNWLDREGYGPFGITGLSMGGIMGSLAAVAWNRPVALVPCLAPSSASSVFTEGVLAQSCGWKSLINELEEVDDIVRESLRSSSDLKSIDINALGLKNHRTTHSMSWLSYLKSILNNITWRNNVHDERAVITLTALRFLLDRMTNLSNWPPPVAPDAAIVVVAARDAYVPLSCSTRLHEMWNGSELRTIDKGHVSSFLLGSPVFIKAIEDSFDRLDLHLEKQQAT